MADGPGLRLAGDNVVIEEPANTIEKTSKVKLRLGDRSGSIIIKVHVVAMKQAFRHGLF
jgi:hypothetical protein